MKTIFDSSEVEFIQKTMQLAIRRAADALSVLLHESVEPQALDFRRQVQLKNTLPDTLLDTETHYLLTSLIQGDWTAQSFLLFSQNNIQKMSKVALGEQQSENKELKEALLLEADNILTAAVVSEMVDLIGLQAYGDLPQVIKTKLGNLANIINQSLKDFPLLFSLSVNFYTKNADFSGCFIWCFPEEFKQIIQQNTQSPMQEKKLTELWRKIHSSPEDDSQS